MPFLIGDLLLLLAALWIVWHGTAGLDLWKCALVIVAVAIGAWLAVVPFLAEYRASVALTENAQLANAATQLGNLEALARQISSASSEWQRIHQSTTQTVGAADQVAEKMIAESRSFGEVLSRINDVEKNHLRLEVDKLRRAEAEWLQVLVRTFDHIHALYQAAVHSEQKSVAEQISHFQNACREAARRIGFLSIVPKAGMPFDEKQHQLLEGQEKAADAVLSHVIAPGYTFQGQLLRLPVVALGGLPQRGPEAEQQLSFEDAPAGDPTPAS
jgi:molecular chaperone GrpE (heat shock protein)